LKKKRSSVAVFVPIGHQVIYFILFYFILFYVQFQTKYFLNNKSENVLIGSLIDEGVEVRFHTSKLQIVPTQYNHLSGLADFFSSKVFILVLLSFIL